MKKHDPIKQIISETFHEGETYKEFSRAEMEVLFRRFRDILKGKSEDENSIYLENLLDHLPDKVYFKDLDSNFP